MGRTERIGSLLVSGAIQAPRSTAPRLLEARFYRRGLFRRRSTAALALPTMLASGLFPGPRARQATVSGSRNQTPTSLLRRDGNLTLASAPDTLAVSAFGLHKELFDAHRVYDLAEMRRRLAARLHWYNHAPVRTTPSAACSSPPTGTYGRVDEVLARSRRVPAATRATCSTSASGVWSSSRSRARAAWPKCGSWASACSSCRRALALDHAWRAKRPRDGLHHAHAGWVSVGPEWRRPLPANRPGPPASGLLFRSPQDRAWMHLTVYGLYV